MTSIMLDSGSWDAWFGPRDSVNVWELASRLTKFNIPDVACILSLTAAFLAPEAENTFYTRHEVACDVSKSYYAIFLSLFGPESCAIENAHGLFARTPAGTLILRQEYAGNINRVEASRLLHGKPAGSYIVRLSLSLAGSFAVSVVNDSTGPEPVTHYAVLHSIVGGRGLYKFQGSETTFLSMRDVLEKARADLKALHPVPTRLFAISEVLASHTFFSKHPASTQAAAVPVLTPVATPLPVPIQRSPSPAAKVSNVSPFAGARSPAVYTPSVDGPTQRAVSAPIADTTPGTSPHVVRQLSEPMDHKHDLSSWLGPMGRVGQQVCRILASLVEDISTDPPHNWRDVTPPELDNEDKVVKYADWDLNHVCLSVGTPTMAALSVTARYRKRASEIHKAKGASLHITSPKDATMHFAAAVAHALAIQNAELAVKSLCSCAATLLRSYRQRTDGAGTSVAARASDAWLLEDARALVTAALTMCSIRTESARWDPTDQLATKSCVYNNLFLILDADPTNTENRSRARHAASEHLQFLQQHPELEAPEKLAVVRARVGTSTMSSAKVAAGILPPPPISLATAASFSPAGASI
jgi:hypothetical protein